MVGSFIYVIGGKECPTMNHTNNTADVCDEVLFLNIPIIILTFPCILLRYYCPKYNVCTNLVKYVHFVKLCLQTGA